MLTALVTVCFDLIEAVEIGIVRVAFLRADGGATQQRGARGAGPPQPGDDRAAAADGAMFFAAERIRRLSPTITGSAWQWRFREIIRMSQIGMFDATGAHARRELAEELEPRGITADTGCPA